MDHLSCQEVNNQSTSLSMVECSNKLHCEYRQDLQFLNLPTAPESYLYPMEEQQLPAKLFVILSF
jgi:hypothetical protein